MKILFVQAGLGAGGAEKVMSLLARHRLELGDDVHVAALNVPKSGVYHALADGVQVHAASQSGAAASGLAVQTARLKSIRRAISEVQPDVIISFLTKVNTLTTVAAAGSGIPVIVSERNNMTLQMRPIWRMAAKLAMRRARAIVLMTERARRDVPKGLQGRVRVIPNACPPFRGITVEQHTPALRLVAVGRLDRQKGFDILLGALPSVLEQVPGAHLTIFGEGPLRQELEEQTAALGLRDAVRFAGNSRVPGAWLQEADILVAPSRYEGFSNVVAEATVSGLPVVAFDCDYGPRELIRNGENGFLVASGDVAGLSAAVVRLLQDDALRLRMANSYMESRNRLDPAAILKSWDEIIDEAAAGRPRPATAKARPMLRSADQGL
jgi:glycosyltransferase involved in cell wall biosynthesis